ncbi:hypothetical protein JAAARDRAFT_198629 [Jaapia argillacea MUCL 33604]|uniref:Uncharacterized protein n=1 Tax=Jaapia argillacea MUCL 33604 TaxID=933084 RepID=A0A067PDT6_9AGAM|nr:hypothetical protein JAAARDRAFT_198629 [Jaapia argillacea MUCL 33604]
MAPSIESSCEGVLPLIPPTPVRIIGELINQVLKANRVHSEGEGEGEGAGEGAGSGEGDGEGEGAGEGENKGGGENERTGENEGAGENEIVGVGENESESNNDDHEPGAQAISTPSASPIKQALTNLATTSVAGLFTSSPLRPSSQLPPLPIMPISPQKPQGRNQALLAIHPVTELERKLQEALQASEAREEESKA